MFDLDSHALLDFYRNRNVSNSKFALKHVSESFIFKKLKNLKTSKSTRPDEIPARFLKDSASFMKIPVTFIVNMSISENCVPNNMKQE